MKKDINVVELKEAIGEEGIKNLIEYIQEAIQNGIKERLIYNQNYIDKLM